VAIVEAPDDKIVTAFGLSIGRLGNVRTETMRAFTKPEMESILNNVV
ncbi:MAG: GYD domain-containing protein, partial [Rhizobiales bacterium]|nr:GYD domain-containing protein [Hyphomicrobiales bacterium]